MNCSDLFGAKIYASSKKDAISVFGDKLLMVETGFAVVCAVFVAKVAKLDMGGTVDASVVVATAVVGNILLLETFEAPRNPETPNPRRNKDIKRTVKETAHIAMGSNRSRRSRSSL